MISINEFLKTDYCLENPWNTDFLEEDPDELFYHIEINDEKEIAQVIEEAKQIPVYTKNYFFITKDIVNDFLEQVEEEGRDVRSFEDFIYDYADNFGMDYFDDRPERMDLINKFAEQYLKDKTKCNIDRLVGEFNDAQYYYTSGQLVDHMDLSKEAEAYIAEEFEEEYARFKKMRNKKLSSNKK